MSYLRLRAALRTWPRSSGVVTVSIVGTSAVVISAYLEADADTEKLPLVYDSQAIAAHWQSRPLAALRRRLELTFMFMPFALQTYMKWRRGELSAPSAQAASAGTFRTKLEEAGPTFIKLGQALSSRPDLLPPPALQELLQLCDQCPMFDWHAACQVLTEGLRIEPEKVFCGATAEAYPVSAASLGQVYRWEYLGRKVAVKVQRPDLKRQISLDLYCIRMFAAMFKSLIEKYTKSRVDHVMLVDAWAAGTWSELDYMAEGANQEELRNAMSHLMPGRVYIPEVVWEVSSRKVLVTEWIDGPKLAACSPEVVQNLVSDGIECFALQLLELGLFHSDPHPGNILVRDGQLVLIDFGLVARIEKPDMSNLALAVVHLIRGDHDRLFDDMIALGFLPLNAERDAIMPVLSGVLNHVITAGSDMKARAKTFHAVSNELNHMFFEFPFEVPPYFALITRAILTLEGVAIAGNENFDIFQSAYPFVLKHARSLLLKGDPAASAGMAASALAIASVANHKKPCNGPLRF